MENHKDRCRLCISDRELKFHDQVKITEEVELLICELQLKITLSSSYSDFICGDCHYFLEQSSSFRNEIYKKQQQLAEFLVKSENSEKNVKNSKKAADSDPFEAVSVKTEYIEDESYNFSDTIHLFDQGCQGKSEVRSRKRKEDNLKKPENNLKKPENNLKKPEHMKTETTTNKVPVISKIYGQFSQDRLSPQFSDPKMYQPCYSCGKVIRRTTYRMHRLLCVKTTTPNPKFSISNSELSQAIQAVSKFEVKDVSRDLSFKIKNKIVDESEYSLPDLKKYICDFCGEEFKNKEIIHAHVQVHTLAEKEKLFYCSLCTETFFTLTGWRQHQKQWHFIEYKLGESSRFEENLNPEVPCHHCKKMIKIQYLEFHSNKYHRKSVKFHCDFCGDKLYDKRQVRSHVRSHVDAEFREKIAKTNLKKVNSEPPKVYLCSDCGKIFRKPINLRMHAMTHKDKMFMCSYQDCNRSYRRKYLLKQHENFVHRGIKKHVCDHCGLAFISNKTLQSHIKTVHENKAKCPVDKCHFSSNLKSTMKYHLEKKHFELDRNYLRQLVGNLGKV